MSPSISPNEQKNYLRNNGWRECPADAWRHPRHLDGAYTTTGAYLNQRAFDATPTPAPTVARQDQIRWMTMPELQARVVVLETALQALLAAKALKAKRGQCQKYVLAKTKAWALARQAMEAVD